MKIGIDGFSYHRYFGQAYPGLEQVPAEAMTVVDFVDRAAGLGAEGLAVESFMLPGDPAEATAVADQVGHRSAAAGLELMWAWGHPNGLGSGSAPEALADLEAHADLAVGQGVRVMRICAGGRSTRPAEWAAHRRALLPLLEEAADHATARGLVLAVENHADLHPGELVELITAVGSPAMAVCLDTANNLRMLDDPDEAIDALAPFAAAVHLKDVRPHRGDPKTFRYWPSVPVGTGVIDIRRALRVLRDNGFTGLLAIEIDYQHPAVETDEDQSLTESIRYVRDVLAAL